MLNSPMLLFLTLVSFYFLGRGNLTPHQQGCKIQFSEILKGSCDGSNFSHTSPWKKTSMSYCGTAHMKTLMGNTVRDTLNLPCKFFCSAPWTTKFQVFKKKPQTTNIEAVVRLFRTCSRACLLYLSCINLNIDSRPPHFSKKYLSKNWKQVRRTKDWNKKTKGMSKCRAATACSSGVNNFHYWSTVMNTKQNVRCSHVK